MTLRDLEPRAGPRQGAWYPRLPVSDEGFEAFRAAHRGLLEAVETCERPDWLVRLAWDAGLERRALIEEGLECAIRLHATDWNGNVALFWPVPRPLEAVEVWCGRRSVLTQMSEGSRPHASAIVPGCVIGAVISTVFVSPRLTGLPGELAICAVCVAAVGALGLLFKVLIDATLRRQVARLDEERAFAIVLEQIRVGMKTSPLRVPRVTEVLARQLAKLVATTAPGS